VDKKSITFLNVLKNLAQPAIQVFCLQHMCTMLMIWKRILGGSGKTCAPFGKLWTNQYQQIMERLCQIVTERLA